MTVPPWGCPACLLCVPWRCRSSNWTQWDRRSPPDTPGGPRERAHWRAASGQCSPASESPCPLSQPVQGEWQGVWHRRRDYISRDRILTCVYSGSFKFPLPSFDWMTSKLSLPTIIQFLYLSAACFQLWLPLESTAKVHSGTTDEVNYKCLASQHLYGWADTKCSIT